MRAPALSLLLCAAATAAGAASRESRIDQSKHNFFGPGERSKAPGMDLCQFCHVPNRLETANSPAPLWEKAANGRNTALTARADPSGPPLALRWAGSTLRCLSCHDSTVSSISIVFRPGSVSLRFDPAAADKHGRDSKRGTMPLSGEDWQGSVMGNHPVSVPYPLQLEQSEYRNYQPRGELLATRQWDPDPRTHGLKMFTDRSGFDVISGTAGVECASCHDPHGTGNAFFLRITKERSELCLSCHRK